MQEALDLPEGRAGGHVDARLVRGEEAGCRQGLPGGVHGHVERPERSLILSWMATGR